MAVIYYRKLLPSKSLFCALSKHYGFNSQYGLLLQERAGLTASMPVSKIKKLTLKFIERNLKYMKVFRKVGKDLREQRRRDISFYRANGSYRGLRMKQNLPCRGQRTKTNARTHKRRKKAEKKHKKKK